MPVRHPTLRPPAKTALSQCTPLLLLAVSFAILLTLFILPETTLAYQTEKTIDRLPAVRHDSPIASLTVDTAITTLYQLQSSQIYLLVTNSSAFPLCVKDVVAKGPNFVTLTPESLTNGANVSPCVEATANSTTTPAQSSNTAKNGFTEVTIPEALIIPAGQESTIAVQVTIPGTVQTGKQLLAFEVGFQWTNTKQVQSGNLAMTQSIDVEVLGESSILMALSIPSLLFLPGFLIVIVWRIFMELSGQDPDDGKYRFLQPQKPEAWPLSVLLSIGICVPYFYVTNHNFVASYGLVDIAAIWIISIGLAVLLYFLYYVVQLFINWFKTWQKARITPTSNDGPIDILYKLGNQNLSVLRNYVTAQIDDVGQKRAFLLEKYDDNNDSQKEYWLSPPIIVKWNENSNRELQDQLNQKILQGPPGELAQLLNDEQNKGSWTVIWGSLKHQNEPGIPTPVKKENIVKDSLAAMQYIVQQEF